MGRTITAETAAGDDDYFGVYDPSLIRWSPGSPYTYTSWSALNYDVAYAQYTVTDPLAPTATGSATAPVDMTSPYNDPIGDEAAVRSRSPASPRSRTGCRTSPSRADSSGPARPRA